MNVSWVSRDDNPFSTPVPRSTRHPVLLCFGRTLRALRLERGLSQEQLAFKAKLDRSYVGGVERGERNVSLENICRLAEALEMGLPALFDAMGSER